MKHYGQACAIARALDVVGERWSLLLVRELTLGPRRYRDLAAGLPGIPSNVLAARLKDLQVAGVITRCALPAPTDVTVYELTGAGRALQPALRELLDWGLRYAPEPSQDDAGQPGWALLGAAGRPAALPGGRTCELRVGPEFFYLSCDAGKLTVRAVQGAGGALVAPAALSLITTTFPEGPPRNRALGVYAAMSIAGGAMGLIGGGLLTTYASWRWVLFVNAPIGAAVALAAPRVLAETPSRRGRFDLPGAITGTGAVAALVYGLVSAATSPDGVSHWGDAKVVASLAAAAVLLAAFAVIETRTRQALLPVRLLRDRNRTGAYLSYAGLGIFVFGMFFFLTVFMQAVWGYSALKTGVAYLPFTAALLVASGAAAQLMPKTGARPLLLAGSAAGTGGLYWLSRINEHATYTSAVLGPTIVIGAGTALLFVTLSLVALNRVPEADSGVAASLLNTGQQVGGAVGLAVLGTVAWTAVANNTHAQAAHATAAAARAGHPIHPGGPLAGAIYHHALATGFARGFLVAAGIALLTLAINIAAIRIRRADLAGAQQPVPAPPAGPTQPR